MAAREAAAREAEEKKTQQASPQTEAERPGEEPHSTAKPPQAAELGKEMMPNAAVEPDPTDKTAPPVKRGPPPPKAAPPAEPGQQRLGFGVPADERMHPSLELPPVMVRGEPEWHIWTVSVFLPELRKMTNSDDLATMIGDNDEHLKAARKEIDVADLKELDAAITKQWDEIGKAG